MDGARISVMPTACREEMIPVCVIHNFHFEAAGIAFDLQEARDFNHEDGRRKEWLLVPRKQVLKQFPYVEELLN